MNMFHAYIRILAIILCGLLLLPAAPLHAQADEWILVPITTVATEQADGVDLEIYFTLRDAQGNVVLRNAAGIAQNGAAQLQMRTGPNTALQPATVSEPQTPLSIILLIDVSGSMTNFMESVRLAAQKAVDAAPPGAQFSVFRFSRVALDQPYTPLVLKQTDREIVKQVIGSIQVEPGGETCLYNAAYKALEHPDLQVAQTAGRRALILFTDGRDSNRDQTVPCSSIGAAEVIRHARTYRTPLHFIGLCNNGCGNVDQAGLREIARETAGFAAFGEQAQIEQSFRTIMDGLSAQWVARARVLATAGPNRGTLEVSSQNRSRPLAGEFDFESSRDYFLAPGFALERLYDADNDQYELRLTIDNPRSVKQIAVRVLDEQAGTLVGNPQIAPVPPSNTDRLSLPIIYSAEQLTSGSDYCFQISATDQEDRPIRLPADRTPSGQDPAVLAVSCGQHRPVVRFEIVEVQPNYETGRLLVQLRIVGLGKRQANVRGEILNSDDIQIGRIDPVVPMADQTIAPLLAEALQRGGDAEYTLRLSLETGDQPITAERKFLNTPPAQPSWLQRNAPLILAVLLVGSIGAYALARRKSTRPTTLPEARPIRDAPDPEAAAPLKAAATKAAPSHGPPVKQVRLRVLNSPGGTPPEQVIVKFPRTIGRAGQILILGDKQVSREHIELSLRNGALYLTDLGSSQGTFIDRVRLKAHDSVVIQQRTKVRLGNATQIELEPETE
jgi:Mg-chelatase subunit ChlD